MSLSLSPSPAHPASSRTPARLRTGALLWLLAGFTTMAVLVACGGGGAVGSGGTGATASGTVTGFGSVIVDGVRFDDSKASKRVSRTKSDDDAGGVGAELKMGQQLEFSFEGATEDKGVASSITVTPRLIGRVTSYTTGATTISVMGVTININTVAANGPVTQFETTALSIGSRVEVHAVVGGSGALTATRIEDTLQTADLLRGPVSSLSATSVSIHGVIVDLAGLSTTLQTSVKNAASAVVFGQYDQVTNTLTATGARVIAVPSTSKIDGYLSGYVGIVDTVNSQFTLNGLQILYGSASGLTTPVTGQYVRVRGVHSPTVTGQFIASKVQLRSTESSTKGGDAEVSGTVTAANTGTTAGSGDITVRGVKISYTSATNNSCSGTPLFVVGTTYVEVHGNSAADGIAATTIKCETEPTSGTVGGTVTVERVGVLATIVTPGKTAGTFTMTVGSTTVTVKYDAVTVFPRSPILNGDDLAQSPAGTPLEVEGYFESTTTNAAFIATKIKKQSTS